MKSGSMNQPFVAVVKNIRLHCQGQPKPFGNPGPNLIFVWLFILHFKDYRRVLKVHMKVPLWPLGPRQVVTSCIDHVLDIAASYNTLTLHIAVFLFRVKCSITTAVGFCCKLKLNLQMFMTERWLWYNNYKTFSLHTRISLLLEKLWYYFKCWCFYIIQMTSSRPLAAPLSHCFCHCSFYLYLSHGLMKLF